MKSHESKTCSVVRLTEREDMTTDDGYRFAQSAVNSSNKRNMVLIWSAIPCTGGSPWQNINIFQEVKKEYSLILRFSKLSGRHLLCLSTVFLLLEEDGESVWSGLRAVHIGIGKMSDHFRQHGICKKFVSMGVPLV